MASTDTRLFRTATWQVIVVSGISALLLGGVVFLYPSHGLSLTVAALGMLAAMSCLSLLDAVVSVWWSSPGM